MIDTVFLIGEIWLTKKVLQKRCEEEVQENQIKTFPTSR